MSVKDLDFKEVGKRLFFWSIIILIAAPLAVMAYNGLQKKWQQKIGVSNGYVLFAPTYSTVTYLIDSSGKEVHSWKRQDPPGAAYLLPNGDLLRAASSGVFANDKIKAPGAGEYIEQVSWDGELVWRFKYSDDTHRLHHDFRPLPNGNILMIAWERKSDAEAIAAGRNPELLKDGFLLPDSIIEVKPTLPRGGEVVWEWHLWDHLIQDHDRTKKNYGEVAKHPELVDINFLGVKDQADWNHLNAMDYNEELDQIVLSSREFGEFWVIDHSATTAEAAGHKGGKAGKGGDILYRWGNPQSYRQGTGDDQKLFGQHDVQWIKPGLPGAGRLLVFNNGDKRPAGAYSSIEELVAPLDGQTAYALQDDGKYGPDGAVWTYADKDAFYSQYISGMQRLPNGNTLVCDGGHGEFFEVNQANQVVWRYKNPFFIDEVFIKGFEDNQRLNGLPQSPPGGKRPIEKGAVFKARWYPADFSGFAGKQL